MQAFLRQNAPKRSLCKELKKQNKNLNSLAPQELLEETCLYTNHKLSLPVNITSFPKMVLKRK